MALSSWPLSTILHCKELTFLSELVDSSGEEWYIQDEFGTSGGLLKETRSQLDGASNGEGWNNLRCKKIILVLDLKLENKIYTLIKNFFTTTQGSGYNYPQFINY